MKIISNDKTGPNTVELVIEVGADELGTAMEEVYQKEVATINVPGFRKGKAPRRIIEKMYGENVFLEDAVNKVYPKAYSQAIEEAKLEPVAPGDIEITEADPKKGFTFKAVITVKPEVSVKDYKGIEATKQIRKVTDAEIDKEIERLRERNSRLVEVTDRPAADGDTAVIDFEGFVDGVPFEGGKAERHELVLGSKSFIDGFEDQIVGKNIGDEFDVTVTFPEEYHAENLAGKPAVFKVKLHELKAKEYPALDDEFAKDVSEFDTMAQLREDLRENLQKNADKEADDQLENELVSKVIENMSGDIPEVMYEARVDQMIEDFSHRLSHQGMNLDLYLQYTGMDLNSFRKTFREQAERQVKISLALEKIAEEEKIIPTQADIDAEYERFAEMYQMEVGKIKELLPEASMIPDIARNKAIDLIRDTAKVTEQEKPVADAGHKEKKTTKKDAAKS